MITKDNPCADCDYEEGSRFCLAHCPYDVKHMQPQEDNRQVHSKRVERMKQVVIEISDDAYEAIIGSGYVASNFNMISAIRNGIVIPDNPTNGDVIKAIFPSIEIIDLPRFKEVYTGIPFGKIIGANIDCMRDWWDASYERGEG